MLPEHETPAWMEQARCRGCSPSLFFPTRGEGTENDAAKRVCAQCPVIDECLEYALVNQEKVGVWGGTSEKQRRKIRRARGISNARRPVAVCGTESKYSLGCRCEDCAEAHRKYNRERQQARRWERSWERRGSA